MTNQVNQEFEDFYNENKHLYTDTSPYGIMLTTFQAATQASESEINSLKERVEELQADNERLREALEAISDWRFGWEGDCGVTSVANNALSSTSTQSLAKHDNDVIERIATALENAEGEFKTLPEYVSLVRALKVTP